MEHALENSPVEPGGRFKNSNLAQAWLVLVLAVLFGSALAAVQVNLSDIITENKRNETLEKIPELVWGETEAARMTGPDQSVTIIPGTLTVETDGKTDTFSLYKVTRQKQLAGWVIKSGGQGYADKIELLVGLDPEAQRLTGLFILDQKETPGLGNKISTPEWRHQFVDKPTAQPLEVVKSGPKSNRTIDAVTGATISSRSVTGIINSVMAAVKGKLTPANIRFTER